MFPFQCSKLHFKLGTQIDILSTFNHMRSPFYSSMACAQCNKCQGAQIKARDTICVRPLGYPQAAWIPAPYWSYFKLSQEPTSEDNKRSLQRASGITNNQHTAEKQPSNNRALQEVPARPIWQAPIPNIFT